MKKLISLLVLTCFSMAAHAQLMFGKPQFAMRGGMEGRNYAVLIKSGKNRRDQVDGMTHFLRKYGIVEHLNLDEINDRTTDLTVPFTLYETQDYCKGMMGVKYLTYPVMLDGELRFEFNENGDMLMVIQNLKSRLLTFLDTNSNKPNSAAREEYNGEGAAVMMANSALGRFLIWANIGFDNMDEFYAKMDNYFADVDHKYRNYTTLVKSGEAKWMTPEEYVEFLKHIDRPGKRYELDAMEKYVKEGRLPGVPEDRWQKKIRDVFDMLFIGSAEHMNAEIFGVGEDGIDTWARFDDKLLPVDEKLRKTYIKKGWTYQNHE